MIVSNKVLKLVMDGKDLCYYLKEFLVVNDPVKELVKFCGSDLLAAYTSNWSFSEKNGIELTWVVIAEKKASHDKIFSPNIADSAIEELRIAYLTLTNGSPTVVGNKDLFIERVTMLRERLATYFT